MENKQCIPMTCIAFGCWFIISITAGIFEYEYEQNHTKFIDLPEKLNPNTGANSEIFTNLPNTAEQINDTILNNISGEHYNDTVII